MNELTQEECNRQISDLIFDIQKARSVARESEIGDELLRLTEPELFSPKCENLLKILSGLEKPNTMTVYNVMGLARLRLGKSGHFIGRRVQREPDYVCDPLHILKGEPTPDVQYPLAQE